MYMYLTIKSWNPNLLNNIFSIEEANSSLCISFKSKKALFVQVVKWDMLRATGVVASSGKHILDVKQENYAKT